MAFRIQLRRDVSDKWSANNPVLFQGEAGYETNTGYLKIGNGITPWNDLSYFTGGGVLSFPYKVYTATVIWNRNDGVVDVNVLQNTLGNMTLQYLFSSEVVASAGISVTSSNLFTENKTFVLMNGPAYLSNNGINPPRLIASTGTSCIISSESEMLMEFDGYGYVSNTDDNLTGFIEIRVYN